MRRGSMRSILTGRPAALSFPKLFHHPNPGLIPVVLLHKRPDPTETDKELHGFVNCQRPS